MTAPPSVSPEGREVLSALCEGLELRKHGDGWLFVGAAQDLSRSTVRPQIMATLLAAEFVRSDDGATARITPDGRAALQREMESLFRGAMQWLTSDNSGSETL